MKVTDKQIRSFFWNVNELPFNNKASFLLGDITTYGISRCKKSDCGFQGVWYMFDVYKHDEFTVSLVIELPYNFTLRDIEQSIVRLWEKGGMTVSDDVKTMRKWLKDIKPVYAYDHAKYSAIRFLEALRKKLLLNKKSQHVAAIKGIEL